tara:strand:+ start:544 stop:1119 length:576 start_codon:yes stop_codon:yes gene_type:complete
MRHLHLEKHGLHGLAISESFSQDSKKSVLTGIVMSTDLVIDGFILGHSTIGGDDATDSILSMYEKLDRPDVSFVLISGIVISLYNIVNVKRISEKIGLPVIGVTYKDSDGIEEAIKHHFPESYESKLAEYSGLGSREKITLHTSHDLYIRNEGCTVAEATQLLNRLTLHGSFPEPLRIAQMLANTLLKAKF